MIAPLWEQVADLAARAEHATVDVVVDHTRPNTWAVVLGGRLVAMRGGLMRCDDYAALLRRDPALKADLIRQSQGWKR